MQTGRRLPNLSRKLFALSAYLFALSVPISIAAGQFAAGMVIIAGAALLLLQENADRDNFLEIIAIFLFICFVVASAVMPGRLPDAIPLLKKTWVLLCFVPLALLNRFYSSDRTTEFLIIGTGIASSLALFRFFTGAVERAAPYSGGYTTLALFEAAMLPLLIVRLREGGILKRSIIVVLAVLIAAGLFFTETRAGWLAGLAGLLIAGLTISKRRTLIGLAALIVLAAAIPATRSIIFERFQSVKKGGVTSGRAILLGAAAKPLAHIPLLGYGPGSFRKLVPPEVLEQTGDPGIESWHSTPLEILMESGPVTLGLFIILACLPLRRSWTNRGRFSEDRIFHTAVFASIVSLYIAGLTTNVMRDFMVMGLLTLIWGVAFSNQEIPGIKNGMEM